MASQSTNGSDLGFEADLFKAADKLRGNLEPSEYKHVALGLIFLKYISEAFEAHRAKLAKEEFADPEDAEEYLAANVFWVPPEARWEHLQANAKRPQINFTDVNTGKERVGDIGNLIDNAMDAIERANAAVLKDVLPKEYGRPQLDKTMLGELIDLFSKVGMHSADGKSKDLLGRAYEYFISQFAGAEGRRGGEFFTPRSVVQAIVEMLEPHHGRVYDPACGSGGMFVQSERFIENHQGRRSDIAIYGQERNHTTWKLCKMNLAVRGIDADIKWNNEGSFLNDAFPTLKFDYAMANPPFNISDWWQPQLEGDVRWKYGQPPAGNANFAWLQHIIHHLAPRGTAGVVLANGSMSSQQSGEGDIRKAMIEGDVVDCMVALPGQLFYSTQIPACLWFLARDKGVNGHRDRRGEILFIDARNLGHMVDRKGRRGHYVALALTIISAWRAAGSPRADLPHIGTYGEWSDLCREPLVWLNQVDPASSLIAQIRHDPDAETLGAVMREWHAIFGSEAVTLRELLSKAENNEALLDAITDLPVMERGAVNRHKLGWYFKKKAGRIVGGLYIAKADKSDRNGWCVRCQSGVETAAPDPMRMWDNATPLSIGVQKGPPIGVQKGPPSSSSVTGMTGALFALVAA